MANGARHRCRRWRLAVLAAVSVLAVAGCDTVERTVDFDRTADFSGYANYVWSVEAPGTSAAGEPPINPLVRQRVEDAIARSLAARGYVQGSPADFAVAFTVGVRERTYYQQVRPSGPFYDPTRNWPYAPVYPRHAQRSYSEGTIAVDIFDAASGRPVWHGRATKPVDEGDTGPEAIQAVVDAILADFPPRQAGAPPPQPR